ncbi:Cullin family-domain-containing protein [Syncephalastrum racemosum]|uniref:Cullin family-domain-containing protein n=1 Tax=Syncephalastrum racemosum TaxID=13706 RepID=A0A1X2H2X0_SYNRA|nr:Cullin family-domain-containing protein [Syncephalastrum racemosum]
MPPKNKVTKKRKASVSSGSQNIMEAFRRNGSPSKMSREAHTSPMVLDDNVTNPAQQDAIAHATVVLGCLPRQLPDKKLVVHRFQEPRSPKLPDHLFEDLWSKLHRRIVNAFNKEGVEENRYSAYKACETICKYHDAEELFHRLEREYAKQTRSLAETLKVAAKDTNEPFLPVLKRFWVDFSHAMNLLQSIFMDLDRRYVIHKTKYASIIDLGQRLFQEYVMDDSSVQHRTVVDILGLVQEERDGTLIDVSLIHSLTDMMVSLNIYSTVFEPAFLENTRKYYAAEASRLINSMAVSEYLLHVKKRYDEEGKARIEAYIHSSSRIRLMEVVTEELVFEKNIEILEKGLDTMIDNMDKEPLHVLYCSLESSDHLAELRTAFADYIKQRGVELIKDPSRDSTMITSLLTYKNKLDTVLKDCFDNDASFANTLKDSFETFVNSRKSRPAELLAKFIDARLRASTKKNNTEEDLERLLDRLLVIFRYLQGKDAFEAFYKRFLSKRLLLSRVSSTDLEKNVLLKLKTECGPGFTKNMEAMFNDIEVSAELNNEFKASAVYPQDDMHMHVNVLAQGIWPTYAQSEFSLPSEMVACQVAYEKFYTGKFKGRRLAWQNALSACTLRAHFPKGAKELTVSLLQSVILLLFNNAKVLSYGDIANQTNLESKELKRVLHSLACGQHKVLTKEPRQNEVVESDVFHYNSDFTANGVRLKINVVQQEQSSEERKATETKVIVDRQHQLEAAIVRIMKAKKTLTHTELMNELFGQLKFPLQATDIKKRIESLIDREYLARDNEQSGVYNYKG